MPWLDIPMTPATSIHTQAHRQAYTYSGQWGRELLFSLFSFLILLYCLSWSQIPGLKCYYLSFPKSCDERHVSQACSKIHFFFNLFCILSIVLLPCSQPPSVLHWMSFWPQASRQQLPGIDQLMHIQKHPDLCDPSGGKLVLSPGSVFRSQH